MTSVPTHVGPYEVSREVGRGGMGVVYLGRDPRLERDVAIKALPEHFAQDPARLERFEREARTLAQLSHPNIAGIHGVEEQEGARYLVLEYVEGETLQDRLDRGAIPIDEALELACQIASGVEAAHGAGVVHRDLKPANIRVTPEGVAKVLDFGLARTEEGQGSSTTTQADTLSSPAHSPTMPGAILGTAPYMSPEQARGRRVDKRTDVWSFGVVLYEMLTGIGPFHGETATDSIGAILHKDADLDRLPPGTPGMVRHVLGRCLERDKERRYRDIGDVRIELLGAMDGEHATEHPAAATQRTAWLAWAVAGIAVALLLIGAALFFGRSAPEPAVPMRVTLGAPGDARILFTGDLAGPPVVSPDGTKIAFCAVREGEMRRLWVRDLSETGPRELSGTDGALFPFWSPDSREVGFFTVGSLKRYDLANDTVQRVCDADQPRGGSWTEDGRIIFTPNFRGGLFIVDAGGGEPVPLTEMDAERHTSHRWAFVVPGTDKFLYSAVTARVGESDQNGLYVGALDGLRAPVRVMQSDYRAEYHGGRLLYVRDGVLLAQPFDLVSAELSGTPTAIAHNVASDLSTWHGQFSASGAGVLVFNKASDSTDGEMMPKGYAWAIEGDRVTSFDYSGRTNTTYATGMPMQMISLSPDGSTLAMVVIGESGFPDIWLHPTAWRPEDPSTPADPEFVRAAVLAPEPRRLTFLPGAEIAPVWAPNSDEIVFRWDGDDVRPRGIYRKRIGGGTEVLVRDNEGKDDYPQDWSPDGRFIIFTTGSLLSHETNDIWALPLDGGDEIPLVVGPGTDYLPRVSPDGRWLAYTQQSTGGRNNIYVIPFAPAWEGDVRGRRWLVSENGGRMPRWSREGDELFYISDAAVLIAVDVDTSGETFTFSTPRALFQPPWDTGRTYAPTPEGDDAPNGFVFLDTGEASDAPISVILNWRSLLESGE